MHLGIVRLRYTPFGGAERIIQRLVSAVGKYSMLRRITIFSMDWPDGRIEENPEVVSDIPVEVVKIKVFGFNRLWRQMRFLENVRHAISQRPSIDILQSHERLIGADIFRAGDGVHAAWLDRLGPRRGWLRNKLIRADPFHRLICSNERKMANDPNTVFVANSPLAFREIQSYLQVPDNRVRVIPNGFESEYWRKIPRDEIARKDARMQFGLCAHSPCVVFVGSGFERKGLGTLIMAVALMAGIQLLVVGRDRNIAHYKKIANKQAPGRVKFLEGLERVEVALTAADVFCLPSLYDSFSNAALEALGAGLPVVLTKDAGLHHYIEISGGGVVCVRDPDSIKMALEEALSKHASLSGQALALAGQFDHSLITPMWLDLYQNILDRKSHS